MLSGPRKQGRRAAYVYPERPPMAREPSDVYNIIRWWDSTDIADGVNADAGNWTDRIAGEVATQVTPFKRDGELWGSARTLRGIYTGSSLAYAPAGAWTLPGANVTIVHVFRGIAASQGYEWVCLCSGTDLGNCHRQWGYSGAIPIEDPSDRVGLKSWNKNTANTPTAYRLEMPGKGWGNRIMSVFRAPTSPTTDMVLANDTTSAQGAGWSGSYAGTDGGRIMGSGTGTQHGLYGYLRAILAFDGAITALDRSLLANYFDD